MTVDQVPFDSLLMTVVDNRGRTCPTADRGKPLIATNCVKNDALYPTLEKVRYVSEDTYRNWFRGHPEPGDLIFVTKGSPGQVCLTPDPVPFCIAQDMVSLRADPKKVYPPYLFAALRSEEVQNAISNMHVGTLIPHFKKGDFDKLLVPLPNEETQRYVGDLYLFLSQKIDLNRRMNETLDAMAKSVFKDWFIDFGPSRAKVEGSTPYLASQIWEKFPNCLDESGLPIGWKLSCIGEIAIVTDCLHSAKPPREDTGLPLLQLYNIRDDSFLDMQHPYLINEEAYALWTSRIEATGGDCVITNVGRVGAVAQIPPGVKAAMGRNMTAIRCAESFPFPTFLIECLRSAAMAAEINRLTDVGTILSALNVKNIPKLNFICPTNILLHEYESSFRPVRRRIEKNLEENRNLASLRDFLLPKIIHGEASVRDAEKVVEAVS